MKKSILANTRVISALFAFCLGLHATGALAASPVVVIPLGGDDLNAVWAQRDGNHGGVQVNSSSPKTLNSIQVDIPKNGFVVVSGHVFINAYTGGGFSIDPKIDGQTIQPGGNLQYVDFLNGELDSMSYTATATVSKGTHTISQDLAPGSSNYFHNREYLTVMYFPAGSVETKNTPAALSETAQNVDSNGMPIAR